MSDPADPRPDPAPAPAPAPGHWWSSLPGVLTALAGLVTAVAGLVTVMKDDAAPAPAPAPGGPIAQAPAPTPGPTPAPTTPTPTPTPPPGPQPTPGTPPAVPPAPPAGTGTGTAIGPGSLRLPELRTEAVRTDGVRLIAPQALAALRTSVEVRDPDGFSHLRAGPSTASAILGRVNSGQRVVLLQSAGNWWKVRSPEGREGYMHASRLPGAPAP